MNRIFGLWIISIAVTPLPLPQVQPATPTISLARAMVRNYRYDDALVKLQEALEQTPDDAEALSLVGTVYLYRDKDFLKAKKQFEESYRRGGRATFWVNHSHEKLGSSEMSDYCRGWLLLGKAGVQFAPEASDHGFQATYAQVKEFKPNRLRRAFFHISFPIGGEGKNYNFQPRTKDEGEVLLILAMYKAFTR